MPRVRASLAVALVCSVVMVVPVQARAEVTRSSLLDEPAPVSHSEDARLRRFFGALGGGLLGGALGLTLNLIPDTSCFGRSCFTSTNTLSVIAAVPLAAVGATAGHVLFGGRAGWLSSLVGVVPGAVMGVVSASLLGANGATDLVSLVPAMVATGVVTSVSMALALSLREDQLDSLGAAAAWGSASAARVGLELVVSALTLGSTAFVTALLTALTTLSAFGSPGGILLTGGVGLGLSAASGATLFAVHRAMGGKGSLAAGLLGVGVPLALFGGLVALYALSGASSAPGSVAGGLDLSLLLTMGALTALFVPTATLEWSHAERLKASLPQVTVGAGPVQGGGMVSAGMRF